MWRSLVTLMSDFSGVVEKETYLERAGENGRKIIGDSE